MLAMNRAGIIVATLFMAVTACGSGNRGPASPVTSDGGGDASVGTSEGADAAVSGAEACEAAGGTCIPGPPSNCRSGNFGPPNCDPGPSGSVCCLPAQADAATDAPGSAACLAAGGQCIAIASDTCTAIGFQDCGPGAMCCLDVCSPDAAVIQASSYDRTCSVDTDCTDISEGSTCNACNFSCQNAAININALPQYNSDTANLFPAAFDLCPSSCGGPQPTCCHEGTCHRGYPTCPYSDGLVDAGADSGDASAE
jgi:hypothetical protein